MHPAMRNKVDISVRLLLLPGRFVVLRRHSTRLSYASVIMILTSLVGCLTEND